jgi:DNA-binding transcriptional ArsR family regulator
MGDSAGGNVQRWEAIGDVFSAVAHPVRVAILESLVEDEHRPLTEVAEEFGYSRSAIQKHVERLQALDAVYRPQESDRNYAVTPLGMYLADLLASDGDSLFAAVQRVEQAEEQAESEFEDVPLDASSMKKAVNNRKWEIAEDELVSELEAGSSEVTGDDGTEE